MSTVEFKDRVAIVTGAGGGLGRSHALELARRGVKVVVNDLGGSVDGTGGGATMADNVVAEIIAEGGEAIANGANVTNEDLACMVISAKQITARRKRVFQALCAHYVLKARNMISVSIRSAQQREAA